MLICQCDGCKETVSNPDVIKCAMAAQSYGVMATEQFCPTCLERAPAFWTQKQAIVDDMGKQLTKRLTNYARSYFKNAGKGSSE